MLRKATDYGSETVPAKWSSINSLIEISWIARLVQLIAAMNILKPYLQAQLFGTCRQVTPAMSGPGAIEAIFQSLETVVRFVSHPTTSVWMMVPLFLCKATVSAGEVALVSIGFTQALVPATRAMRIPAACLTPPIFHSADTHRMAVR
jgi:hypothetical protein